MYRVDRKHRERAMHNLRRSFPQMSERQQQQLSARQCVHQLGRCWQSKCLFTTRLIRLDTWVKYCRKPVTLPSAHKCCCKRGQGVIMLTGHYGNWEILGYVLATIGFETTSVARPLDNPYLNDWIMGVRERQGQKIVGKKGATTEVVEVLERGGAVGFIADQNAGSKGVFVDFFGRKASTYKSIGLLAMHYNVPVVIGYARRVERPVSFQHWRAGRDLSGGLEVSRMIPCATSRSDIPGESKTSSAASRASISGCIAAGKPARRAKNPKHTTDSLVILAGHFRSGKAMKKYTVIGLLILLIAGLAGGVFFAWRECRENGDGRRHRHREDLRCDGSGAAT